MANRFARMTTDEIINEMGWNEESEIVHLEGFIASEDLEDAYQDYLAKVAEEEEDEAKKLEE